VTAGIFVAQSLTIQAVLVSPQPSAALCLFHELEQLGSEGEASSLQFQWSGTHCCVTFAHRPSVAIIFEQGSKVSFHAGLSLTFPLKTIEEIELNLI